MKSSQTAHIPLQIRYTELQSSMLFTRGFHLIFRWLSCSFPPQEVWQQPPHKMFRFGSFSTDLGICLRLFLPFAVVIASNCHGKRNDPRSTTRFITPYIVLAGALCLLCGRSELLELGSLTHVIFRLRCSQLVIWRKPAIPRT